MLRRADASPVRTAQGIDVEHKAVPYTKGGISLSNHEADSIMHKIPFTTPPGIIPQGRIADGAYARQVSELAASEDIPLLEVMVEGSRWPQTNQPYALGMGSVRLSDDCICMTIRFQFGSAQCYFLAHPDDPEAWALLETWATKKRSAFMFHTDKLVMVTATDFPGIDSRLRALRNKDRPFDARRFCDLAFDLVESRDLVLTASSDVPSIPRLRYVHVCVLATRSVLAARPLPPRGIVH
jgi:hypothetical protein